MPKSSIFLLATLGMLTAFGPFVTDFYLPVLPQMAGHFHTTPALMSMSLTTGMMGLAGGQLFIGPLSDKFGRKRLLVISMLLFAAASALCIWATNIFIFNLARFFQGIAGAGGIVLSKSMATDLYTGPQLTHFMAILGAINGIAPVCAPVVGGTMANLTSWQGIFATLLAIGIILLVCCVLLTETLSPSQRLKKNLFQIYANLFRVFKNQTFSLSTFAQMFCHFTLFGYIAASPFILQQTYSLNPFLYSLCFGTNALALGIGSICAAKFKQTTSSLRCGAINLTVATLLLGLCLILHAPLLWLMLFYVYTLFSFGLTQPGLTATAMDAERHHAGAASAIFGASAFLAGAIVSPIVTIGQIPVTSSIVMLVGALGASALILPLTRRLTLTPES